MVRCLVSIGLVIGTIGTAAVAETGTGRDEQVQPSDAKPAVNQADQAEFPLPKDATAPDAVAGGGGKILLYKVSRGRDAVVAEVRNALKQGGWVINKDDASPSGRATRFEAKKGDTVIKASFTGDADRTAIILTLP